jgi:hypothetical protein
MHPAREFSRSRAVFLGRKFTNIFENIGFERAAFAHKEGDLLPHHFGFQQILA